MNTAEINHYNAKNDEVIELWTLLEELLEKVERLEEQVGRLENRTVGLVRLGGK